MNPKQDRAYQRLLDLLSVPTAPFKEFLVSEHIQSLLERHRVPFFLDPYKNLIVGCNSPAKLKSLINKPSQSPVWCLMAHMDHPGFHGVRWLDDQILEVNWHGGSPTKHLIGANVWLTDGQHNYAGNIGAVALTDTQRSIKSAHIKVTSTITNLRSSAKALFGGFKFRQSRWRSGKRLYTQVADDLAGVHAILETQISQFSRTKKTDTPVIGLLTRGEEVGFVGAVKHLELEWYRRTKRPLTFVSIETSRALPGAEIGKGPVIRQGDRRGLFDDHPARILDQVASAELGDRYQTRWMDGGACEASAVRAFGHQVTGLSLPLGNYHNQGIEGGQDCRSKGGPAPEFVHLDDVNGLVTLCKGLLKPIKNWHDPWKKDRAALIKSCNKYRKYL